MEAYTLLLSLTMVAAGCGSKPTAAKTPLAGNSAQPQPGSTAMAGSAQAAATADPPPAAEPIEVPPAP